MDDDVRLAEPRRKQKWGVNPRGKLWTNDKSKKGQKMLEQMGWKDGDGLGVKREGNTEPVTLKWKQDVKGVGYKQKDEAWIAHQDDFNSLLSSLNNNNNNECTSSTTAVVENGAKGRKKLLYKKFTAAKDISNYSSQDLDSIFGNVSGAKESEPAMTDVGSVDNCHGIQTITGGSMADYFASMMAKKGKSDTMENGLELENKKTKKLKQKTKVDEVIIPEVKEMDIPVVERKTVKKRKGKKRKDSTSSSTKSESRFWDAEECCYRSNPEASKKKSKKIKKMEVRFESMSLDVSDAENIQEPVDLIEETPAKTKSEEFLESCDIQVSGKKRKMMQENNEKELKKQRKENMDNNRKRKEEKLAKAASGFPGANLHEIKGYGE